MTDKLKITWMKSNIGGPHKLMDTIRGLGLRRLHHTVIRSDRPEIRGMVKKVIHLVRVEEFQD